MTILFSQASIFHLSRLGALYSGKVGKKYSLSNEAERLELLRLSDTSHDLSIRKQFSAFVSTLEPETLHALQNIGIGTSVIGQESKVKKFRLQSVG